MTEKKDFQKDEKFILSTFIKLVRVKESVSANAHKHLSKERDRYFNSRKKLSSSMRNLERTLVCIT